MSQENSIFDEKNSNQSNINAPEKDEPMVTDNRTKTGLPKGAKNPIRKKMGALLMVAGAAIGAMLLLPKFFSGDDTKIAEQPSKEMKKQSAEYRKPEEKAPQKVFSFDESQAEQSNQSEKLGYIHKPEPDPAKIIKSASSMMVTSNDNGGDSQANTGADNRYKYSTQTQQAITNAQAQLDSLNAQVAEPDAGERLGDNSNTADIFKAPAFQAKRATKSIYNSNLLLAQGTYIPCVLRGRLVSNISGQISCVIAENVFSENGNVLLIEKGSRVNGYYQGGNVKHGHAELFVVWQEVRTPHNIIIPLDSGAADELGASGLSGWVDNHFWERFSNAIFLSMIRDVSGALASRLAEQSQQNTENTREASEQIAAVVLQQMGDIAPTVYKNQGDKIGIFVARDIDFSQVYELKRDY